MNSVDIHIGSQIAPVPLNSTGDFAQQSATPKTLSDLLIILAADPPKTWPMLQSTASKLAEYCGKPLEGTTLDQIFETRGQFRRYLEKAPYTENSVRSYVNYVRILLQMAVALGWQPGHVITQEWQEVLAQAPARKCLDVARYFSRVKKSPRDVTANDVEAWAEGRLKEGASFTNVRTKRGQFWRLLKDFGCNNNLPPSVLRVRSYQIPFDQFPQQLKSEVEGLLKWKTADFSLDRPKGAQIRQITAKIIRSKVCHLLGFALTIRGMSGITSLPQLVSKELLSDYVAWCINDRGVKGQTLLCHLGRLEVALRQHPSYAKVDFKWFRTLLDSLPIESESERRMRKVRKYLEYPIVEAIPAKIRAERSSSSTNHP